MLDLSTCLVYYKREDIQKQLLSNASSRELGVRYLNGGFGKRPDILHNEADVLEFAKQNVSSFHISEEHWANPLTLSSSLSKKDMEKLRSGWDLIIDIDCPDWELSKRITFVIIKILKKHGIQSISCKFSGNKGFHVGVPFSAFPKVFNNKPISHFFPEGVKRIISYLVYVAERDYSEEILAKLDIPEIAKRIGISEEELASERCLDCHKPYTAPKVTYQFLCEKCGTVTNKKKYEAHISCPKCKSLVKCLSPRIPLKKCTSCSSTNISSRVNLHLVLGLDEILISPRHLYRMAYSLHEKSGLASLPINPFSVLAFDKKMADPLTLVPTLSFLEEKSVVPDEALNLLDRAYMPRTTTEQYAHLKEALDNKTEKKVYTSQTIDQIQEKIPLELFPPSIHNMLNGVKDGRKRALFVLINFLTSVGWNYDEVEETLKEWNKKNPEPLRDTNLLGQIKYHKAQGKKIMPPNYSNNLYYADLGVLTAEDTKGNIKNPVTYAKRRAYFLQKDQKRKKPSKKPAKKEESKKTDSPPKTAEKK